MNYCYIRVSTDKQEYNRQLDILKNRGYDETNSLLYTETYSAKSAYNRPVLQEIFSKIKEGDVIVVESLSRLARSTMNLLEICEILQEKNVSLISIKEHVDLTSPMGKFFITIMGSLSQLERDLTSERTKEALKVKKANGVKLGRPREVENLDQALAEIIEGKKSVKEASLHYGITQSLLYYHVSKIRKGGKINE